MTTTNVPAPIRPTDGDSIIGVLADGLRRQERNVNDPRDWIYVGSGAPAPDFQNGFSNAGGSQVLLRYRFLRPYDPATTQNAVQIQGSVVGGSLGLVIFTLLYPLYQPDGTPAWQTFTLDYDVHLTCCNDNADLIIVTVKQSGDVIYGFA